MNKQQHTSNQTGGIGFFGLLAIAFIVLKLVGYIGWSWWWVLSPLWLPILVVFVVAVPTIMFASFRK